MKATFVNVTFICQYGLLILFNNCSLVWKRSFLRKWYNLSDSNVPHKLLPLDINFFIEISFNKLTPVHNDRYPMNIHSGLTG